MKTLTVSSWGLQSRIAKKLNVSKQTISRVFIGDRPTAQLAEKLEAEFVRLRIPINRWDLLYERPEGQSLADYLKSKKEAEV